MILEILHLKTLYRITGQDVSGGCHNFTYGLLHLWE